VVDIICVTVTYYVDRHYSRVLSKTLRIVREAVFRIFKNGTKIQHLVQYYMKMQYLVPDVLWSLFLLYFLHSI
jgi:hypothetical protein